MFLKCSHIWHEQLGHLKTLLFLKVMLVSVYFYYFLGKFKCICGVTTQIYNAELIYTALLFNTKIEVLVIQRKKRGRGGRPVWEWSGCNPCICVVNKIVWNCRLQLKSHVDLVPEEGRGSMRRHWGACLLVLLHYPDVQFSSFSLSSSLYLTALKILNSVDKPCFRAVLWTSSFRSTCQSSEVYLSGSSYWFCRVSYSRVALNNFPSRECLSPQGGGNK